MKATKIVLGCAAALLALLLLAVAALWLRPPELLRVGANYSAKVVCSNVFLAGRDPDEVLRTDVQGSGIALLRLVRVFVDRDRGMVRAGFLGFIGDGLALMRPGVGCAAIPDGRIDFAQRLSVSVAPRLPPRTSPGSELWPEGSAVEPRAAIQKVIDDPALAGPGMRAIVVVDHGRIVAERYAAGFSVQTPLLGWSMAKSVVAGLIGILVKDGQLSLDQPAGWPTAGDGRERIRIADLLSMTSGLRFNEGYGAVSDITRMLYLEPDMAAFARAQPLEHPAGEFWSYSSGTAVILSRIVQDAAGGLAAAFADQRLFEPLGMSSATMETDEFSTLVGSSYMYATARDWARYAQFLLQDGVWQGQEILPRGYVAMMTTPVAASGGQYGAGQIWRWGPGGLTPDQNPDTPFAIPADTFWMEGHDGQSIAMVPSRQLAVVRLGLTPSSDHYLPQRLLKAVLDAAK